MLDMFGILFSSIIMMLVILRAVQMDLMEPWFGPKKTAPDSSGLRLRPETGGPQRPDPAPASAPAPRRVGRR